MTAPAPTSLLPSPQRGRASSLPIARRRAERQAELGGNARTPASPQRSEGRQLWPQSLHDLSRVRIHADAEAKRLVQEEHAHAFVKNGEIWIDPSELRPETTGGRQLLAHEMTHVEQQRAGQAPEPIQRQEKKQQPKLGLGSTPPEIEFTRAEGPANEQEHVLFPYDSDKLSPADRKKLEGWAKARLTPVIVELHGYASHEGPDEYNLNLSAHRAAAVKRAIEDALPIGSRVEVVARGETGGFATPDENRRVGLEARMKPMELTLPTLSQGPLGRRFTSPPLGGPLAPLALPLTLDPSLVPKIQLGPQAPLLGPGTPPYAPTAEPSAPDVFNPSLPRPPYAPQVPAPNTLKLTGDFYLRGLAPTSRDYATLLPLYESNYRLFQPLKALSNPFYKIDDQTIRDWASSAAGAAAGFSLQRDHPTGLESFNREGEKYGLPKPTVIPLKTWEFDLNKGAVDKSQAALKRWHEMQEEKKKEKAEQK